ncbi:MAG: homoserine dehydrogenase [Christensenellales bacterium]
MEKIVVGFLGCGNIGCGVYKLLETYGAQIEENEGVGFEVRKILVRSLNKSRAWAIPSTLLTDRPEDVLDNPEIDMVMEFMGGEQPAASYMVRALENGKCVITANKMALATHGRRSSAPRASTPPGCITKRACAAPVPIIRAINGSLQANRISSVMGIINGTTNYILTRMANEGAAYADVLADAQRLGLAEPDPTADVEGYDAAYKLSILSTLAFHRHVPVENVYRGRNHGRHAAGRAVRQGVWADAQAAGRSRRQKTARFRRVCIRRLCRTAHPLAGVNDAFNAVFVK